MSCAELVFGEENTPSAGGQLQELTRTSFRKQWLEEIAISDGKHAVQLELEGAFRKCAALFKQEAL
jgi:hypothetical protein